MIKQLNQSSLDRKYLSLRPYTATPISADFSKLLVNKPWGNEYMLYSSPSIEVWNLFIGYQKATSMHCHPNKKTSLIVIEGRVLFSSLNESLELTALDAVAIGSGTFHSTQCASVGGARVLEFESPPMKHDLIRLEDKYGRTQDGYEGAEKMIADEVRARLSSLDHGQKRVIHNNEIFIKDIRSKNDLIQPSENGRFLAIILSGVIKSKTGEPLYGPSDPISLGELKTANYIFENTTIMFLGNQAL